jgi:hypothetical protein
MKATQKLHDLGQSLWLDNITRDLLSNGTLKRYIDELSVTGLTSNPTIFDHAIKNSRPTTPRSATSSSMARRGQPSAAQSKGPRRRRTGLDPGMGALRWSIGPCHWHEDVRGLGPPQGVTEKVGFEPDRIVAAAKEQLGNKERSQAS